MSKLSKEDFDNYLGTDEYYKKEDKERFYKKVHAPKGWRKHWLPQILTVALVMGIFIVGVQYFLEESTLPSTGDDEKPKTEWSNWIKAKSLDDVEDFYESTIPGLKIAKELNQVIAVNQNYTLEDGTTISIDKAWYHGDKIYLFYSVDLSDVEVTDDQEIGKLYSFHLKQDDNKIWFPSVYTSSHWNGVVYQTAFINKIYREATITLHDANRLVGKDQLTASLSSNADFISSDLPEITLPVSYGSDVISSNQMYETIQTKNSIITLNRFDYGAGRGYLFGSIDSKLGQEIEFLSVILTFGDGEKIDVSERVISFGKGEFAIEIPELTTENVSINLEYLSMIDNEDTIDIPIDVSDYDPDNTEGKTMNEKVDTVGNTNVFLSGLHFDDRGASISFSVEKVDEYNPGHIQLVSILPETGSSFDDVFPNILTVVDNNGMKAGGHQLSSPGYEVGSNIYSFGVSKSFITDKKQITATIRRLSFGEELDWTVEIPKQE